MTEVEYEDSITFLNNAHEEYANYIKESKAKIASAITEMGVETSEEDTPEIMASNIRSILGKSDTDYNKFDLVEIFSLSIETLEKSVWYEEGTRTGTYGVMSNIQNGVTFTATKKCTIKAYFSMSYLTFKDSYITFSEGCTLVEKLHDENKKREYIIKVPEGESVTMFAHGINYSSYSMGLICADIYTD